MPPCYWVSRTITRMTRVEIDGASLEVVHLTAPDGGHQRAPIVFLHEGRVYFQGTADELRASTDPVIADFIEGRSGEPD